MSYVRNAWYVAAWDLGASPVVNLGQDKAWILMRQIVQRLIQEEQQHAVAA